MRVTSTKLNISAWKECEECKSVKMLKTCWDVNVLWKTTIKLKK